MRKKKKKKDLVQQGHCADNEIWPKKGIQEQGCVCTTRVAAKKGDGCVQETLDAAFINMMRLKEFSKAKVLHAVTRFIICDDQVCLGEEKVNT